MIQVTRALSLVCLAGLTAGCAVLLPTRLQRAKDAAETSPIVVSADYHAPGDRPREFLEVLVTPSATEAEVHELWCVVLAPYGVTEQNTLLDYDIEDEAIAVPLPACAWGPSSAGRLELASRGAWSAAVKPPG